MDGSGSWNVGYGLYVSWPELTVTFARAGTANGLDYDRLTTSESLPTGRWTHLVATYDGATMRVFFDGVEKASMASTRNIPTLVPREFYVGMFRMDFGVTDYPGAFYGWIDEAAVYGSALSGAAVLDHFLSGAIGLSLEQTLGGGGLLGAGFLLALNQSAFVAEPVNTATGNYVTGTTDLALPGIGVPFSLTRTYNSLDATFGALGPGWTHSLAWSLLVQPSGDVVVRGGDGQQLYFTEQGDGSFEPAGGGRAELTSAGGGYELLLYEQTKLSFDTAGRLLSIRDRNDRGLTVSQGTNGPVAVTDSVGRVISFTYAGGFLSGVALPDGRSVSYAYTNGRLSSVTDVRGYTTSYSYDASGRLATIVDQRGNTVLQSVYGPDGRVVQQTDARGNVSTFAWDRQSQTATFTDARGKVWTDVYSNNLLIERRDPLGNAWRYEYDLDLSLTMVTDPRGQVTTMSYDLKGNLLSRTTPAGTESWTYNSRNDVVTYTDGRGNTTSYGYDGAGNLVSVTEPGPTVTLYGRDPGGTGLLTSVTDPRGKTTSYGYTGGNLTSVSSPLGYVTTMGYDPGGRLTSLVEPRGNLPGADPLLYTTSFVYNAANQRTSVTSPLGHSTSFTYDPAGNLSSVTDANNHTTSYGYDAAGNLSTVTAPHGAVTSYGYDPTNNLSTRTDANNHVTSYGYDDAGRLTSFSSSAGSWGYQYDPAGNRTQVSTPSGGTIALAYDGANRLTSINYSDTTPDVSFSYDANGNRTQMSDGAGVESYGYDALDRLTSVTRGADSFSYAYDAASNLLSRSYPGGATTGYGYDDDGRLTTVTAAGTTTYSYDAAGNLLVGTLPGGCVETRGYDRSGRLTSLHNACNAAAVSSFVYTLDGVGNPTSVETHEGTFGYGYDAADRLVFYSGPGGPLSWTYDPVGNRLSETRPAGTTSYTYNAADQLTQTSGPGGTVSFSYDLNGNQAAAGSRTFTYDLANRLVSTTLAGQTVTYSYDGVGKRLSAQGATTTNYLWDPNAGLPLLALERDGAGSILRRYTYGAGLLGLTSGAAAYYYLRDGLGSVINLANAAGVLQWSYGYEPYGAMRLETQNDPVAPTNPMRFSGQLYDPSTGLYHLRARDYDPASGRFLQTDPLARGLPSPYVNAYSYADAQPTTLIDPSGLAGQTADSGCGSWVEKIPFIGDEWCEGFKTLSPGMQGIVGATLTVGETALGPGKYGIVLRPLKGIYRTARGGQAVARNVQGGVATADDVLRGAERWLGEGYREIAPGVFRSQDGLRQFRMTTGDLTDPKLGPHVHFESIASDRRTILENAHVLLRPGTS